MMMRMTAVCRWCGETLVDGKVESGFTGPGPDWMTADGDFGCDAHPMTDGEGTASHQTTEMIRTELEQTGLYT